MDRRRYLRSIGTAGFASAAVLSGCLSSDDSDDDEADDDEDENGDEETMDNEQPADGPDSGGDTDAPSVSFDIAYHSGESIAESAADGHVEITHTGGDTVDASNLFVRGESIYPRADDRWDQQYTDTDGTVQPPEDNEVVAGVSVFVDADSTFDLEVVWTDPDSTTSSVLAAETGPDA